MISTKTGTQTWSKAPQQADYKSDGAQNVSATDQQKYFGNDNVGDTLNRVADPGYVDSGKKMRTVGDPTLGKDAFMSLLLSQMKNQDPTNPLKSHEMAAQLAQFTSLEKLNNINEGINNLRKDNQPDHNFQALSFIGKTVTMDNSKITRTEVNENHDLRFMIPADAQKATVEVKDATGAVVRKMEMKNLKAGPNHVIWDGKTDEGANSMAGDYTLSVEAIGSNGKKLFAQTKADGIVTGVNFSAHGPQLLMGKQVIQLSDVKQISDSHVGQEAPQMLGDMAGGGATPNNALAAMNAAAGAGVGAGAGLGGHMIPLPPTAANAPLSNKQKMAKQQAQQQPATFAATNGPSEQSLKKVEVKPELQENAAKRAKLAKGNLNDLSMTQGLINHLNKEGAKAGM